MHDGSPAESSDPEIRPAQPAERAECARLMAESDPWLTLRRSPADCLRVMAQPGKEVYLAAREDQVLGFVILDLAGPFPGYLQTVCVAPAVRGRGLGTRLIEFAERRIFRESPNVFLCVSSFNADARRLYRRLGYREVGVLRGYLVAEHDEVLLRKSLSAWEEFRARSAGAPAAPPAS